MPTDLWLMLNNRISASSIGSNTAHALRLWRFVDRAASLSISSDIVSRRTAAARDSLLGWRSEIGKHTLERSRVDGYIPHEGVVRCDRDEQQHAD